VLPLTRELGFPLSGEPYCEERSDVATSIEDYLSLYR
jgi:hypothetical protein